jgi:hypothetical protein
MKFLNFLAPGSGSGIRIPNTDPDPQSHWIRIQSGSGSGSTTLQSTVDKSVELRWVVCGVVEPILFAQTYRKNGYFYKTSIYYMNFRDRFRCLVNKCFCLNLIPIGTPKFVTGLQYYSQIRNSPPKWLSLSKPTSTVQCTSLQPDYWSTVERRNMSEAQKSHKGRNLIG